MKSCYSGNIFGGGNREQGTGMAAAARSVETFGTVRAAVTFLFPVPSHTHLPINQTLSRYREGAFWVQEKGM